MSNFGIDARFVKDTNGNNLNGVNAQLADIVQVTISQYPRLSTETSDDPRIQRAHDAIVATGKKGLLTLGPDTYILKSPLTINVSYVSLNANGSLFDASAITSGNAIIITGSVNPPYTQTPTVIERFLLQGNSKTGNVTGIYFDTENSSGQGSSHFKMTHIAISNFGTGMTFGNNAYLINFDTVDIYDCNCCLYSGNSVTNGGEKISFSGCTLYNSNLVVNMQNSSGEMVFISCSFDYNAQQFSINDSRVYLIGCHIEAGKLTYTNTPIIITGDGGSFIMFGGWFLQTGSQSPTNAYVVDCSAQGGVAYFNGVFMNNLATSSEFFATGSGRVFLEKCESYHTSLNPPLISSTENLLFDGGFEQSSILDNIFIANDTTAVTSRTTGTNIKLAIDNTQHHSGSQSLKATKVSTGTGDFAIAVPISKGAHAAAQLYYTKPGTGTGTVYIDTMWGMLQSNSSGVPTIPHYEIIETHTINFTSSAVGWTEIQNGAPMDWKPAWATHFIIYVNMDGFSADNIYFDDIVINES